MFQYNEIFMIEIMCGYSGIFLSDRQIIKNAFEMLINNKQNFRTASYVKNMQKRISIKSLVEYWYWAVIYIFKISCCLLFLR